MGLKWDKNGFHLGEMGFNWAKWAQNGAKVGKCHSEWDKNTPRWSKTGRKWQKKELVAEKRRHKTGQKGPEWGQSAAPEPHLSSGVKSGGFGSLTDCPRR